MSIRINEVAKVFLPGILTTFDDALMAAMNGDSAQWQEIATQIDTTLPTQEYSHLGQGGVMTEFIDRLERQGFNEYDFSATDKTYNAPISIPRRWLEDDQYGLIRKRIESLSMAPVRHWNKIAYEGLALGFTSLCYDGQYFFDTDHNESGSNQSNKGTAALSDGALEDAEEAMLNFTDDKGEPLDIVPDTLVVGPKNKRLAWDLTESETVVVKVGDGTAGSGATGATGFKNYQRGRYKVVVSNRLRGTYDDYWFLADTKKPVKPIIIQFRDDVGFTLETDLEEPSAHMKEEYTCRIRGRYIQTYGPWQLAYGNLVA